VAEGYATMPAPGVYQLAASPALHDSEFSTVERLQHDDWSGTQS
jgi:hypothetical protein